MSKHFWVWLGIVLLILFLEGWVSVPRLKLKAALLLADLMVTVRALFTDELFIVREFWWSDSKVVLSWIKAPAEKWQPIVRNRVATIQELVPPECWSYVSTNDNPADILSRGRDFDTLQNYPGWFHGRE